MLYIIQGRSHVLCFEGNGQWRGAPLTANKGAALYWSSNWGPVFVLNAAAVAALSLNQTADCAEGAKMGSRGQTYTKLTTENTVGRAHKGRVPRVPHSGYTGIKTCSAPLDSSCQNSTADCTVLGLHLNVQVYGYIPAGLLWCAISLHF